MNNTFTARCYPRKVLINLINSYKNVLNEHKKENWRLVAKEMVEDNFPWEYEPKREIEDFKPPSKLQIPHEDNICLMVDATNIGDILALENEPEGKKRNHTSKGEQELVTLDNETYLPKASKNLISITQWSTDRVDDCEMLAGGVIQFSVGTRTGILST